MQLDIPGKTNNTKNKREKDKENVFLLGYLPQSERTEDIAKILDMGWNEGGKFFSCNVSKKENETTEEPKLSLSISIQEKY